MSTTAIAKIAADLQAMGLAQGTTNLVSLHLVWSCGAADLFGYDLEAFRAALVGAARQGELVLAKADLPALLNPAERRHAIETRDGLMAFVRA